MLLALLGGYVIAGGAMGLLAAWRIFKQGRPMFAIVGGAVVCIVAWPVLLCSRQVREFLYGQ